MVMRALQGRTCRGLALGLVLVSGAAQPSRAHPSGGRLGSEARATIAIRVSVAPRFSFRNLPAEGVPSAAALSGNAPGLRATVREASNPERAILDRKHPLRQWRSSAEREGCVH